MKSIFTQKEDNFGHFGKKRKQRKLLKRDALLYKREAKPSVKIEN